MSEGAKQFTRFVINGLAATGVHFAVLTYNLQVLNMTSAAWANMVAAIFGISVSFLGSRYYVFRQTSRLWGRQLMTFLLLYGAIAILHGFVLLIWTDGMGLAYQVGFLIATVLQVIFSYFGNKFLVFLK